MRKRKLPTLEEIFGDRFVKYVKGTAREWGKRNGRVKFSTQDIREILYYADEHLTDSHQCSDLIWLIAKVKQRMLQKRRKHEELSESESIS